MFFRNVKYHEPEYWKFGEEGNKYFRHATGQIYAVSKDLATYISINQWELWLLSESSLFLVYILLCLIEGSDFIFMVSCMRVHLAVPLPSSPWLHFSLSFPFSPSLIELPFSYFKHSVIQNIENLLLPFISFVKIGHHSSP